MPFDIIMGDEAVEYVQRLQSLRDLIEEIDRETNGVRKEVQDSLSEAKEVRTLVTRVEEDIDLWDTRANVLRRLLYGVLVGAPTLAGLVTLAMILLVH